MRGKMKKFIISICLIFSMLLCVPFLPKKHKNTHAIDIEKTQFENLIDSIEELEQLSKSYNSSNHKLRVLQYIRSSKYNSTQWTMIGGLPDSNFNTFVTNNYNADLSLEDFHSIDNFIIPSTGEESDFFHFFATLNVVYKNSSEYASDLAGWGGDLYQLAVDVKSNASSWVDTDPTDEYGYFDYCYDVANSLFNSYNSSFGQADVCSDLDAVNVGKRMLADENLSIADAMKNYFSNISDRNRKNEFCTNIYGNNYVFTFDLMNATISRIEKNTLLSIWASQNGLNLDTDGDIITSCIMVFLSHLKYDKINYLAFGDSISAGNSLDGHNPNKEHRLPQGSFNSKIINSLKLKYGNVDSYSYAKSGFNSNDLITQLEDPIVQNRIKSADIISVYIGANDILGLIDNSVTMSIISGSPIDETRFQEASALFYNTNFPKILNEFNRLNPNAKIIFSSVYNPYAPIGSLADDFSFTINSFVTINKTKLLPIKNITNKYVCSPNIDSGYYSINYTIKTLLEEFNNDNFYYLDINQAFTEHSTPSDLVIGKIADLNGQNLQVGLNSNFFSIAELDPHPSVAGHDLICGKLSDLIESNLVAVGYNYDLDVNGLFFDYFIINKGEKISKPSNPSSDKFLFEGWYTSVDWTTKFNFNEAISQDTVLSAKWVEIVNLTVVYENNTKTIQVAKGTTLNQIEKPDSSNIFYCWCSDLELKNELADDYVINSDLTIYAKWINLTCHDDSTLIQDLTSTTKDITWTINVKTGTEVEWFVNDKFVYKEIATSNSSTYTFVPESSGLFEIKCVLNETDMIFGEKITIYEVPQALKIKIVNNKNTTYKLAIENPDFYNPNDFVWYEISQNGVEKKIGTGLELDHKFSSNCQVKLVYKGQLNTLSSNLVQIKATNYTIYLLWGLAGLGTIVVICVIVRTIKRRKFKHRYYY